MSEWTKVVIQPLGLAGFALFLVFTYLGRATRDSERRWLSPASFCLALVALVGGLVIAYRQVPKPEPQPAQTTQAPPVVKQQTNSNVTQQSTGPGSPNVQGAQGDVTITVDQSTGKTKTETKKPADAKPSQESK